MLRTKKYWMMYLLQSLTILGAFLLAWLLRLDFVLPQGQSLIVAGATLLIVRWVAIIFNRLAHGHWRHTGIGDLKDLLWAVITGSVLFFVVARFVMNLLFIPMPVYVMEGLLTFLLLSGLRVNSGMILQARDARRSGDRTPVLIVGAGSAALQLLQALKGTSYRPVGLVDDDPYKRKLKFEGVSVVGRIDELPQLAERCEAAEVLIAIPSANGAEMMRIADVCTQAGLPFRTVPSLFDLVDGRVTISEFREINLDDLLGRDPIRIDSDSVRSSLKGRVIMVTGAAGSIGSELCKQIIRYQPAMLVCVDQAETPLFNLQQHALAGSSVDVVYSVADFTDRERMFQLMQQHQVRVIFHAAAYKHVPMTELNPYEGIQNNVFGLLDLVAAAEECGCEDFLLISTDKAVHPSSLMGCTKRIGEMIVGARESSRMRCVSVRFGNVLGSQGSVIPLFQEQIRTRNCVTVTHPQMTRYFMTIPEAVSLVLEAFTVGEHGNILVLDMGDPIRIVDLAKTLIRISGKNESEVQIIYTGMRSGEKLHEELFYDSEERLHTSLAKVLRAKGRMPRWTALNNSLQELRQLHATQDGNIIRAKVKQIVPEYLWVEDEMANITIPLKIPPALLRA